MSPLPEPRERCGRCGCASQPRARPRLHPVPGQIGADLARRPRRLHRGLRSSGCRSSPSAPAARAGREWGAEWAGRGLAQLLNPLRAGGFGLVSAAWSPGAWPRCTAERSRAGGGAAGPEEGLQTAGEVEALLERRATRGWCEESGHWMELWLYQLEAARQEARSCAYPRGAASEPGSARFSGRGQLREAGGTESARPRVGSARQGKPTALLRVSPAQPLTPGPASAAGRGRQRHGDLHPRPTSVGMTIIT